MCEHEQFACEVDVHRLIDVGRFSADVRIRCAQCGARFRFMGLPAGYNPDGATISVGGEELRAAIAPVGEPPPTSPAIGFRVIGPGPRR